MNNLAMIKEAIKNRQLIAFDYKNYRRKVEPHHYGILNHQAQIHAYQIEGGSKSGGIPEWRNFKLNKIYHLTIEKPHFKPRDSYNPPNSNYSKIVTSLEK